MSNNDSLEELRNENFIFLNIMEIFTIGDHDIFEFEDLYICIYNLLKDTLIQKIDFENIEIQNTIELDITNDNTPDDTTDNDKKLDILLNIISNKTIYELKIYEINIIKYLIESFIQIDVKKLIECFKELNNLTDELCKIGFLDNLIQKINILDIIRGEINQNNTTSIMIYKNLELNKNLPLMIKKLLDISNNYEKEYCVNVNDIKSKRTLEFYNLMYQTYIENTNIDIDFTTNITEEEMETHNPYFFSRFESIFYSIIQFVGLKDIYDQFMNLPYIVKFFSIIFIIYIISNIINIQFSMNK
jgi:hypothetical protein